MYLLILCFLLLFVSVLPFEMYESFDNKNKCAFIIPLHPKHYHYGYSILDEISNSDADVYYVFSTVEDKDLFAKEVKPHHSFRYLIFTDFTPVDSIDINSIVTIKKYYALSVLYDKYDYLCAVDSEIIFIRKTGFYDMMKGVAEQKMIFGGIPIDPGVFSIREPIMHESLKRLTPKEDHDRLKAVSKNFTLYTWWSNPAVYECKDIPAFFKWIDFRKETLNRFVWNIFDNIVYNYYCILYTGYQLKEVPGENSLEFAESVNVEYVNEHIGKIYWVNNKAYKQNESYYNNLHFYIRFHIDRF